MPATSLVVILPAYNEGQRLHTFLQDWVAHARLHDHLRVTAVVVDDGSRDAEAAQHQLAVTAAKDAFAGSAAGHDVRYLRAAQNQGKGASIRWGWKEAGNGADWWGFVDSDGALPATEFWRLASMLPSVASDVLCGSRIKMAGRRVERSMFRHIQGRVFATAVDEMFHLGLYDTQCGLKFFRAAKLMPLLPALQEPRWLLDVELLAHMKRAGAGMLEVPVDCDQHGPSSLIFGVDSVKMLMGLVRLRRRLREMDRSA